VEVEEEQELTLASRYGQTGRDGRWTEASAAQNQLESTSGWKEGDEEEAGRSVRRSATEAQTVARHWKKQDREQRAKAGCLAQRMS
jgi:hypothetical protein